MTGLIVATAIVLFALAGCGGGSSSSTRQSGPSADAAAGAAADPVEGEPAGTTRKANPGGGEGQPAKEGHQSDRRSAGARGDRHENQEAAETGGTSAAGEGSGHRAHHRSTEAPGRPQKHTSSAGDQSSSARETKAPQSSLGGASPVAVRKLRKHCPKNIDAASCTRLVEAYVAAQGTESQPVADPQQCTATHTEAECEVILHQQAEAAEKGESLNVQECIADMTPRCEAALRPLFESQQAAQAGGG